MVLQLNQCSIRVETLAKSGRLVLVVVVVVVVVVVIDLVW
jgi:hypothetical protein